VVGANGFIGRHTVRALRRGGTEVLEYTREHPMVTDAGLHVDARAARALVFVAGSTNPASAERDPALGASELAAFERLLDVVAATVQTAGGRLRVVMSGSGGTVYDPARPPPYGELDPVSPDTAYGRVKLAMEELLRSHDDRLEPVVLRLANAFGPGQRIGTGQGVVAHWFQAAASGRPLELFGDPDTVRDYVYVADVAAAVVAAVMASHQLPDVMNVGSGVGTSLGHLGALVHEVVGRRAVDLNIRGARGFDRSAVVLDIGLARKHLGWVPETSLESGLRATWAEVGPVTSSR